MSKKQIWILALALTAIFLLAACERSAVTPQSQATPIESLEDGPTVALPDTYKTQTTSGAYTALALTMQPGAPSTGATVETPTPSVTHYWDPTITPTTSFLIPTTALTPGDPGAPTPTPGRPATYTLQQGEYPYCIARRYNLDPNELMTLNHIIDGLIYQPGFTLTIPQTGNTYPGTRALRPHPTTYTVQLDDTIYKVACVFGDVDPIYLAAFNSIVAPYTLTTGRILNIP